MWTKPTIKKKPRQTIIMETNGGRQWWKMLGLM